MVLRVPLVFLLSLALLLGTSWTMTSAAASDQPSQCGTEYIEMVEAARYALDAGFQGEEAAIIVAIAWAESSGNIYACNYNPPTPHCPKGSWDRGILQINDCWHPEVDDGCAFDPACAFCAARNIPFSAWVTYSNGMYLDHLENARAAVVEALGLYAGTSNLGLVYGYLGDTDWQPIATEEQLDHAYAVLCLVEYEGHLYAGTMSTSDPMHGIGRVYKHLDGTSWTLVGDNLDDQVSSLAVYQGNLYAGTAWNGMRLYRYTPGTSNCGTPNWTREVDYTAWSGTRALHVSQSYLLMGDIGWDRIGHWDGSTFHPDQTQTTGSCIYDFEDYGDSVYAAAYCGRMWQSSDIVHWSLVPGCEDYYDGNMWELETFQDLLYFGYDDGELWESGHFGPCIYTAPDGIISMETDGVNLYFGTGGEAGALYGSESTGIATVYKYDGTDVTPISHEDEFGTGVQVLYQFRPPPMVVTACSPVDLVVTDPDGLTISKELNEIPGATYLEVDLDGDGELDDQVSIPDIKIGDYLITIILEPGASPTDTYTFEVSVGGVSIVLVENVQISDIPTQGYIVRSTETEIMQIIPGTIDFDPDTLNLKSKGKWVTAYIELPEGYDVNDIDVTTVFLNDAIQPEPKPVEIGDYDSDSVSDLMVKFDRAAVQEILTVGDQLEITISGEVAGIAFEGSDIIKVITE